MSGINRQYEIDSVARLRNEQSSFAKRSMKGSSAQYVTPIKQNKKTEKIIQKYYDRRAKALIYEKGRKKCSLSTTRVRQRLCNLMGTDVIRLNDKRYFQKLSERLQEEYESMMDKEEEVRMASENERLRRLMLEGVIENPHDYRALIHGEQNKQKHYKKKKRKSKRKKRTDSEQTTEGTGTVTSHASEEETESQTDEVITQLELLSRPSSSVPSSGRSRDKRQTSASPKLNGRKNKDKYKVPERDNGVRQYDEERVFHEMHVPPPHRPASSCSLRRKRIKSASARVSYWDDAQDSDDASDNDSREETKSLPDTQRRKDYWKYSKTEKPLVQSLRREETVDGLYSIAEELISPIKAEDTVRKVTPVVHKKKKMTISY